MKTVQFRGSFEVLFLACSFCHFNNESLEINRQFGSKILGISTFLSANPLM
jgi:hypothetical protein